MCLTPFWLQAPFDYSKPAENLRGLDWGCASPDTACFCPCQVLQSTAGLRPLQFLDLGFPGPSRYCKFKPRPSECMVMVMNSQQSLYYYYFFPHLNLSLRSNLRSKMVKFILSSSDGGQIFFLVQSLQWTQLLCMGEEWDRGSNHTYTQSLVSSVANKPWDSSVLVSTNAQGLLWYSTGSPGWKPVRSSPLTFGESLFYAPG